MQQRKFLIIGQGIAGTLLSYVFYKNNVPHKVLDNNHKSSATKAAAGIVNPITGRRFVKSWMIEELLPSVESIYSELEDLLNLKLITRTSILRSLDSISQEKTWFESVSRPGYEPFFANPDPEAYGTLVQAAFAYGQITQAYRIDIAALISSYQSFLMDKGLLIQNSWHHKEVNYNQNVHEIDNVNYTDLIFCEGAQVLKNPLFKELPWEPVKGESFRLELDTSVPKSILRDKIYLAPVSEREFWTGGGFDKKDLSSEPTQKFHAEWSSKLDKLLKVKFRIVNHLAGIRPSVFGRRPIIGTHSVHPNVHIFNGLGTKGTSLGPFFINQFYNYLFNSEPLNEEVDINRFS